MNLILPTLICTNCPDNLIVTIPACERRNWRLQSFDSDKKGAGSEFKEEKIKTVKTTKLTNLAICCESGSSIRRRRWKGMHEKVFGII